MAKSPPTHQQPQRADESAELLATKFFLPRPLPGFVSRPRLLDQLDAALDRSLIVVCAPAGFGKTSLLGEWARQSHRPIAWLSLDDGDSDPARFWRHVVTALDRQLPGVVDQVLPLLGPPPPMSFEDVATALINTLSAHPDEVTLILDDYHLIDAQPVHDSLVFLLAHRTGLRLVVASRADPPFPLARLRASGQLVELRAAELRFTPEEALALLRAAAGADLSADSGEELVARTEGWVAGLQLAGLSLQGRNDAADFVTTFSGSHRYVLDYLTEEVLEQQPQPIREFLLQTSVLDQMSGELCDALTHRHDSQRLLGDIERRNLFVVPLDEVRGWWRYHHLFADLLRARLQQEHPDQVLSLHRDAATWYERHGYVAPAMQHALAAGDATWAARLVERRVDELLLRSERATLTRCLAALPPQLVSSRPRLLLAQALFALVEGDAEAVSAPLDAAENALTMAADNSDQPYEPSVGQAASLVANVPAAIALCRAFLAELLGDADAEMDFGRQALAKADENQSTLGAITRGHLGVAEWLSGNLPQAAQLLTSSIDQLRTADHRFLAVRVYEYLGRVQRTQGNLDAAQQTYQNALAFAAPPGQPALPAAGIAHIGMAEVAYQRDQLDVAETHLAAGISSCRLLIHTQPVATGLTTLAWIRHTRGDMAGTRDALRHADEIAASPGVTSLLDPRHVARARLHIAQGNVGTAAQWIQNCGLSPHDHPTYTNERDYLVLARVLNAQGQSQQALELLQSLRAAADAQDRTESLIELCAVHALTLAACGEESAAMTTLAEALSLAYPQGYIRIFADEGSAMESLLSRLLAAQRDDPHAGRTVPLNYLGRLARAFTHNAPTTARSDQPASHPAATTAPGLVQPLSSREMEVLQLLAAGRQNQEIADDLFVALSTVKKHVTHILNKLGAANRTQAIAHARELGLLP